MFLDAGVLVEKEDFVIGRDSIYYKMNFSLVCDI